MKRLRWVLAAMMTIALVPSCSDKTGGSTSVENDTGTDLDSDTDSDTDTDTAPEENEIWGISLAIDDSANIYFTGGFEGSIDFGGGTLTSSGQRDALLVKLDPNGEHLWSKQYGDDERQYLGPIAVDSAQNLVLAGSFRGEIDLGGGPMVEDGDGDMFIAKLDANGEHLWSVSFENGGTAGLVTDGEDNIIITGLFWESIDLGGSPLYAPDAGLFIAKYSGAGSHQWSDAFTCCEGTFLYDIALDADGNFAIAGSSDGPVDLGGGILEPVDNMDIMVAFYDSQGDHVWSTLFGDEGYDEATSVVFDTEGNLILTGAIGSALVDFGGGPLPNTGGCDVFLAKLDQGGDHVWSYGFGGDQYDTAWSVRLNTNDEMMLAGDYTEGINFGGEQLTSTGLWDGFAAKLDWSGSHLWSTTLGGAEWDRARRVTADGSGNMVVDGLFEIAADFGGGEHTVETAERDIFIIKYDSAGEYQWSYDTSI